MAHGEPEERRTTRCDKQQQSYDIAPESVSKDALDNAINAAKVAKANLDVVTRQYELTKAGAWVYDIKNQEKQVEALEQGVRRLERAPRQVHDQGAGRRRGALVQAAVGSYVSPQGVYDPYTQGFDPVVVMGTAQGHA